MWKKVLEKKVFGNNVLTSLDFILQDFFMVWEYDFIQNVPGKKFYYIIRKCIETKEVYNQAKKGPLILKTPLDKFNM